MKIKNDDVLRLNELFRDLSPDELPYQKDIEEYGAKRIEEAVAIIKNYKSDRGQYIIEQLNVIKAGLIREENNLDDRRKLLNKASSLISYLFGI